jgi:thymidylate synthase
MRVLSVAVMADACFSNKTLDDVMRSVIEEIFSHGDRIYPTKGEALELSGVLLEVTNPRARLSRTETRGKLYSCLGELCWYLARSKDLVFISYYIPPYKESADGDEIFGGYGPRLFNWKGLNQVTNVINVLRENSFSRKAVVQLFDSHDIAEEHKDTPCTCTLQFMIRHDQLHMFTNMRSNDVHWGLPHDVFCFTMLQEIVARSLSVEVGTYKHAVGSLHLYVKHTRAATRFLNEGWQPTEAVMPPMPSGDPWPGISFLLQAESAIRTAGAFNDSRLGDIDPYWADLIRLLQVFRSKKDKDVGRIKELRGRMSSKVYFPFIDGVLRQLASVKPPTPPGD